MSHRKLHTQNIFPIGLGCMNLSHAYGIPPTEKKAQSLLMEAYEIGVVHFDSAALYGFGQNEKLLGRALKPIRNDIFLASKCGMTGVNGKRVIDGRPETIRKTCEESLRNLQTDVIDLYYLHRWDKTVPIEESVGALSDLVKEGKIKSIGLSEVSASTLQKAHKVHPIAAVQSEYSLWSRNVELGILDTCENLDITFVAFSPLGRGYLADLDIQPSTFSAKDIRNNMPRFQEPYFSKNKRLLNKYARIAESEGCSYAQLALAWLLSKYSDLHVIPGTTSPAHLLENIKSFEINLDDKTMNELDLLINQLTIFGSRYNNDTQSEIDTEEFDL